MSKTLKHAFVCEFMSKCSVLCVVFYSLATVTEDRVRSNTINKVKLVFETGINLLFTFNRKLDS